MIAELLVMAASTVGGGESTALTIGSPPILRADDGAGKRADKTAGDGAENPAVQPSPEAQALLKIAWQVKRTSFKKDPDEKARILHDAIKAFAKVLEAYPKARLECGEACFRIGEIYRSLKEAKLAEEAFSKGLSYPENPRFRARCLLELGHLSRRAGDIKQALSFYQRVMKEHAGSRNEASQAMSWAGKVELATGDAKKGRKLLLDFESIYPEYPATAIRNIDRVALWLIDTLQPDEARKLVDSARSRFMQRAGDDPKAAADIEKALTRMRAPGRLAAEQSQVESSGTDGSDGSDKD